MACGPDFDVRVVDACTGDPIPGAFVTWHKLGPHPAAPGVPCAVNVLGQDVADGAGLATVTELWMSNGISVHRVTVSFGDAGTDEFRYAQHYLDETMIGLTTDLAAWPSGGCPPPSGGSGGTGGGSCGDCGELTVITGPTSSWPMGVEKPVVGWRGMGEENPADRCTASLSRIVSFDGACFPGAQWVPVPDLAGIYAPDGTLPLDWVQPQTVDEAGAATAGMVHLLLKNQDYLRTQLFYLMTGYENLAVWANQINQALNVRLLFMNEQIQLMGTMLHGEGWSDRVHVTRADPFDAIHPPIEE